MVASLELMSLLFYAIVFGACCAIGGILWPIPFIGRWFAFGVASMGLNALVSSFVFSGVWLLGEPLSLRSRVIIIALNALQMCVVSSYILVKVWTLQKKPNNDGNYS